MISQDYISGEVIIYANIGGTTLAEYREYTSQVPTWTKSYVYLGQRLLSTASANGTGGEYVEYNHPDRLGTRLITNQATGTVYEQAHLPFGTPLDAESTITTNNRRFTSYDRSTRTGLDYAVNRHYDSKQGRFTRVDPIGMSAANPANPQSFNMYAYVENDPINYTDPSGLLRFSGSCVTLRYVQGEGWSFINVCFSDNWNTPDPTNGGEEFSGGGLSHGGVPEEDCPVEDLTPLDAEAQRMENGERVILDKLTKDTQNALRCLQNSVVPELKGVPPAGPLTSGDYQDSSGKRGFNVKSAYRPDSYQNHFWEILSKLKDKRINRKGCRKLKAKLIKEKIDHELGGIAAKSNSRHSSGNGFDLAIWGVSESQITKYANKCGLGRLNHIRGEETHFYLR